MNTSPSPQNDLLADAKATSVQESPRRQLRDFDLAPDVLAALESMGITSATPIQEKVIEPILAGKDVIGKAETGTGKTIGFGGPLVGKIDTTRVSAQALVLTPTRELAQQVASVLEQLGRGRGLKVALVVGGVHASEQILALRRGSQVVVGTPGRVLDFLKERTLSLVWCETAVVDEADRMFDMGFIDDIRAILNYVPDERQTLLFSATIPPDIEALMKKHMKSPEIYSTSSGLSTVSEIRQIYRQVDFTRKFEELKKILDAHEDDTCIIFSNTRRGAIDLDRMLWGHNYPARALHGEHDQEVRFRTLEAFRQREIRILVATDVASRGLDVDDIGIVINYDVPGDTESYVHRIGRTGRASRTGKAMTLVSRKEVSSWKRILSDTGFHIEEEPPATGRGRGGRGGRSSPRGKPERRGGERRSRKPRRGRQIDESREKTRDEPAAHGGQPAQAAGNREETATTGDGRTRSRRSRRRRPRRNESAPPEDRESTRREAGQREGGPTTGHGEERPRQRTRSRGPRSESRQRDDAPTVDLFDVSMRDFLDVSRPIEDFSARARKESGDEAPAEAASATGRDRPEPRAPAAGSTRTSRPNGQGKSDSAQSPAGESDSRTARKRRRRRSPGSSGGSKERGASGSAGSSGAGAGGETPEPTGAPRKRRRRRRGGKGGSRPGSGSGNSGSAGNESS